MTEEEIRKQWNDTDGVVFFDSSEDLMPHFVPFDPKPKICQCCGSNSFTGNTCDYCGTKYETGQPSIQNSELETNSYMQKVDCVAEMNNLRQTLGLQQVLSQSEAEFVGGEPDTTETIVAGVILFLMLFTPIAIALWG